MKDHYKQVEWTSIIISFDACFSCDGNCVWTIIYHNQCTVYYVSWSVDSVILDLYYSLSIPTPYFTDVKRVFFALIFDELLQTYNSDNLCRYPTTNGFLHLLLMSNQCQWRRIYYCRPFRLGLWETFHNKLSGNAAMQSISFSKKLMWLLLKVP